MFAKTGIAAAQNVVDSAVTTSQNSWDPNKLISESMKARSKEKQMAMRAEAAVRQTEQKLRGEKAIVKRDLDIAKAEASAKRGQRKAGLVAAAGRAAGMALIKTPDPIKPYQSNTSAYQGIIDSTQTQLTTIQQEIKDLQEKGPQVPDYSSMFGGGQSVSSQPVGVQNTDTVVKTPGTVSSTSTVSSMGF